MAVRRVWNAIVMQGYTVDKAGGDTILVLAEPSMYSEVITTLEVGQEIWLNWTELKPDGRLWFYHVNSFAPELNGWVIAVGNTGIPYIVPKDPQQILNIEIDHALSYPLPKPNAFLDNPVTGESEIVPVEGASRNTPVVSGVVSGYNALSGNLPPLPEKQEAVNKYTEGSEPLTTGATIEGGIIKQIGGTTGFELFKNYITGKDISDSLNSIRKNFSIFPNTDTINLKSSYINRFNRFKIEYPDYHLNKTFSHVFITRPDLNIYKSRVGKSAWELVDTLSNDPTFYYLDQSDRELMTSLTEDFSNSHDLNPFLSNLAASFEISDEYIKTVEHGETLTGYKVQYGRHNIESRTAGSFNINYVDDKNLSIYKIHKAWVEYIARVYRGALAPRRKYIQKKVLDYATSAYYFVCGPDGTSILFWAKYYGAFPTNIPSSANSWSKGSMVKVPDYSISYSYSNKEDFNPAILVEFNENSRGEFKYKKNFIPEIGQAGTSFSGNPYIESVSENGQVVFKLRFRE